MKNIYALLAAIILSQSVSLAVFAQNLRDDLSLVGSLPMYVECSFRVTEKVKCQEFIQAFFASNSNVRRESSPATAVASLSVTDEAIDSQLVNFVFSWTLAKETNLSDFKSYAKLNNSTSDSVFILNSIVKNTSDTVKFLVDFIKEHGGGDDINPDKPESTFDRLSKSPLYITMGISGSYNAKGSAPYDSNSASINSGGTIGYLKEKYKVGAGAFYNQDKSSVPTDNGYLVSERVEKGIEGMFVYSMAKRWSIAVINSEYVDKNSNINLSSTTTAGLEWILVPFRTVENQEVAFRVGVNQNYLKLGEQNILGNISEKYLSAFARVYFYWVLNDSKITLSANAGIEQNLQRSGFEEYNAGGSVNYQLTKSLSFNVNGSYRYLAKSLTFPVSPDLSNPLLVQQQSGQAGKRVNLSVGLKYTIGNSLRKTRDRRWAQ